MSKRPSLRVTLWQGHGDGRKTRLAFRQGSFYKRTKREHLSCPMPETAPTLSDLRRSFTEAALRSGPAAAGRIGLGMPALDDVLNGGLARAALHEVYAAEVADLAAATGFALGLALRAG